MESTTRKCSACQERKPQDGFYGSYNYCKVCSQAKAKEWKKANPSKKAEHDRRGWLKAQYGITPEEYDAMYEAQGGLCALCNKPFKGRTRPHVDHCHKTKRVRGLLHGPCNQAIGLFKEDVETMRRAIEYVAAG
jgi:hypothetical protein